jgi:hypothetical protein
VHGGGKRVEREWEGEGVGGVGYWPYNKQYIETNIIFSVNEMYNYEFQAILSANLCYSFTADQTLTLHFLVGWSCFCGFIL